MACSQQYWNGGDCSLHGPHSRDENKFALVPDPPPLLKLDIGCGQNPKEGFDGVDLWEGAKYSFDVRVTPWPFADQSVGEVYSNQFFEHLSGPERIPFMNELWRVMAVGAQATIITPYWSSMRAVQDPTHAWPPVCDATYLYFNKKWMQDNKLDHYAIHCDFDFSYGYNLNPGLGPKNEEYRQFAVANYVNSVTDLQVVLTRRA
ncbi:MAG TPA: class I SAM-dependent methyltransferase [Polyangia bacterium]|nr:class I SAM-dependent methyltransferase [Polyangia bacterium]